MKKKTKKKKSYVARNAAELAEVLGLSPADAVEIEVRSKINNMIIKVVEQQRLTHAEVAKLAGTSRTRITAIMNWNFATRTLATGATVALSFLQNYEKGTGRETPFDDHCALEAPMALGRIAAFVLLLAAVLAEARAEALCRLYRTREGFPDELVAYQGLYYGLYTAGDRVYTFVKDAAAASGFRVRGSFRTGRFGEIYFGGVNESYLSRFGYVDQLSGSDAEHVLRRHEIGSPSPVVGLVAHDPVGPVRLPDGSAYGYLEGCDSGFDADETAFFALSNVR